MEFKLVSIRSFFSHRRAESVCSLISKDDAVLLDELLTKKKIEIITPKTIVDMRIYIISSVRENPLFLLLCIF
ncbi:MAG: hypothetical protein K8T10_17675 [Candidatus Eremiobacteraeota bacterium]|nr:hypothetical protein [Candidatus Eremiobacteraeota bacterium]